ncbi:MAG: hypothetical protein ACRDTH_15495 [Pseudonocardiaceae bacterium]
MSQPNPYLPPPTGVAPGNGYDYRAQGAAQQAATVVAVQVVKKYGPALIKALFRR